MTRQAERVHGHRRRPEAAARRVPSAEAQRSRTTTAPQPRLAAPVATGIAERVSRTVVAKRGETQSAGLPSRLRSGVEALSGLAMDDVRVHRNSAEPAKLGALAFTRGRDIHLGPGQEQHLAHEAWHVAQQKQGRVRATAQMKGAQLNNDPALEAEADHMSERLRSGAEGRRAAAGNAPAASPPRGVIQGKVLDRGKWLGAADRVSTTLRTFIRSSAKYLLRDDHHGALTEQPVHLIDMSKAYLLGETHGAAADAIWDEETLFWPSVPKILEEEKSLSDEEKEDLGIPIRRDPQRLPLESLHAYGTYHALGLLDMFEALEEKSMRDAAFALKSSVTATLISEAFNHITNLIEVIDRYQTGEISKKPTSPAGKDIALFTSRGTVFYLNSASGWMKILVAMMEQIARVENEKLSDAAKKSVIGEFEALQKLLSREKRYVRVLAQELIFLNDIQDADEANALLELLEERKTGLWSSKALARVNPARERAMADRIRKAGTPLLVKLGNKHLPGLRALLGPSAVPVPAGTSLERETARHYTPMHLPGG